MKMRLAVTAFLILSIAPFAYGEEKRKICFDEPTASKMIVELEESRIAIKENALYQDIVASQDKAIETLQAQLRLQEELTKRAEDVANQFDKVARQQAEAYEAALEASQPTIWEQIGKAVGFMGIGALIAIIAF